MDHDKVMEFLGRFVTDLGATGAAGSGESPWAAVPGADPTSTVRHRRSCRDASGVIGRLPWRPVEQERRVSHDRGCWPSIRIPAPGTPPTTPRSGPSRTLRLR